MLALQIEVGFRAAVERIQKSKRGLHSLTVKNLGLHTLDSLEPEIGKERHLSGVSPSA